VIQLERVRRCKKSGKSLIINHIAIDFINWHFHGYLLLNENTIIAPLLWVYRPQLYYNILTI